MDQQVAIAQPGQQAVEPLIEGEHVSEMGQKLADVGYAVFPGVLNPSAVTYHADWPDNWQKHDTWDKVNQLLVSYKSWKPIINGQQLRDNSWGDRKRQVLENWRRNKKDRPLSQHVAEVATTVMQQHVNKNTFADPEKAAACKDQQSHILEKLAPMRSLQGCQAQPKHTDFKWEPLGFTEGETKVARMRRIPYSFIIALHPEGCWVELRPYYQTGHIRVHIPQGAMI